MRYRTIGPVVFLVLAVTLLSCSEAGELSAPGAEPPLAAGLVATPPALFCGAPTTVALVADGATAVGTVRVVNDETSVYVTYHADAGWAIRKTALFVGTSPGEIPLSGGGNPQVGRFPWKATHRGSAFEVTWQVPLADAGDAAIIAAFAEVGGAEGAWGAGLPISPGGSWAMYVVHPVGDCGMVIDPAAGGTVRYGDVVELFIPPDAITGPALVTMTPAATAHPDAVPGTLFDFGPSGLQFDPPAQLTIGYDPARLPDGVPENALRGLSDAEPSALLPLSAQDQAGNTATFDVEHFSIYGLAWLSADLAVSASATPDPARLSDQIRIAVVVTNTGAPEAAVEGAQLLLVFTGLPFIRSSLSEDCTADPQPGPNGEIYIRCEVGPLGPGDAVPFEIIGTPFGGLGEGVIMVTAEVLPDAVLGYADAVPANNGVMLPIHVYPEVSADLRMKAFGPGPARQAGLVRTVSATVENLATSLDPVPATIEFRFPDAGAVGLEVIAADLPAGCTFAQGSSLTSIACPVGALAPGQEAIRQVNVRPLQARTYAASATGHPLTGDPQPANNTQSGSFEATATVLDLRAAIVAPQLTVDVGDDITFSAQVEHVSGDLLPQGTLRIEIEGEATFVEAAPGCDVIDVFPFAAALNCPLPQLEAGDHSATFMVIVQATTGGTDIVGHARFLLSDYVQDTDAANDTDDVTVTVRPDNLADYAIDLFEASAPSVKMTREVTYSGQAELLSASFFPVPGGAYVVRVEGDVASATAADASCSVATLIFGPGYEMTCPLESMVPGEVKGPYDLTVVPGSAPGLLVATARVVAPDEVQESNPADNEAVIETPVALLVADLRLSLTLDDPDPVAVGDIVRYDVFAESATGSDDVPLVRVRMLAHGDVALETLPSGIDLSCEEIASTLADVSVLCDISNHQPQNARRLTLELRALGGTFIRVESQIFPVAATTSDPNASNNLSTQQTTVSVAAPELAGTLVFSSNRVAGSLPQLFTKALATGTVTRITDFLNYTDAQWSPDGTRIVAIRGQALVLMDADGTNATNYLLLDLFDVAGPGNPSWSPDGTKIVLHGNHDFDAGEDSELWIFDVASESLTRLTDNSVDDEFPDWSPDGAWIAYTADRANLHAIRPDGSDLTPLLTATSVLHPDWSPDGTRIAFTSLRALGSSIDVVPIANLVNVTTAAYDDAINEKPVWSPDGLFIAFARAQEDDEAAFDLYYVLANGSGSAQVLEAIINFSTWDVDWK